MDIQTVASMKADKHKTMSVREFALEYGLGANKCYEIVNSKGFPMFRCGKKIVIIRSKVDEWIEKQVGKCL